MPQSFVETLLVLLLVMFATSCLSKSIYFLYSLILALALVGSLSNCSVTVNIVLRGTYIVPSSEYTPVVNTEHCWHCMDITLFPH